MAAHSFNPENKKNRNLSLTHLLTILNFPTSLISAYSSKGIVELYEWQYDCIHSLNVLGGGNLVYSAPTSGGKTLVAEILMLRRIQSAKRKVLFILPFVSVVVEKFDYFKKLFEKTNIRTKAYHSSESANHLAPDADVLICTIEKANALVNNLARDGRLAAQVGCVVLDEIHLMGDASRGYVLELLLAKVLFFGRGARGGSIQVVGLSATLPNLGDLARWLGAALFVTEFRPVRLEERFWCDGVVYDSEFGVFGKAGGRSTEMEYLTEICQTAISEKKSMLIFNPTKKSCEAAATLLYKRLSAKIGNPSLLKKADEAFSAARAETKKARAQLIEKLRSTPFGLDPVLKQTAAGGIAYHHSGLSVEERGLIEDAFRAGAVRVLFATSTLAVGVNLPVATVVIRSLRIGNGYIDKILYKVFFAVEMNPKNGS